MDDVRVAERDLSVLLARAGLSEAAQVATGVTILSLTDDSRHVRAGSCFVAVSGVGQDGHRFVDAAVRSGAAAVVVEKDVRVPPPAVRVRVADTRMAIARLAAAFYGLLPRTDTGPRLIGATGTNGKTTVAWLLRSILRAAGEETALLGTIEYDLVGRRETAAMTTPGPVDLCRHLAEARDAGGRWAMLEVSSHALDQGRCDGLRFDAAIFTNLTGDHLDYHKTMQDYARAKSRLFKGLDADAVAVVNTDDPVSAAMVADCRARVVTYGIDSPRADLRGVIRRLDSGGSTFLFHDGSTAMEVRLGLLGRHNVMNALAAAATARSLGLPHHAILHGLERVSGVPGRLQRAEPEGSPFSVLVDYAHTDDALRNVLQAVRPLTTGRLICVFGCGGDRDRTKRPRMALAVGDLADVAYVTSDNPRTEDPRAIIDAILSGFSASSGCRVEVYLDRRSAIEAAVEEALPGDTVLIAGKGHENYQLIDGRVLPFDDVSVARSCLESRIPAGVAS